MPANAFDTATADALRNDAWLHDVAFVDAARGWAVGDRGTIWHTEDGGLNWKLQDSGVACTLRSVCFLDADKGWAAGGFSHPYLHTSSGVVLATRDGGRHWYRDREPLLPELKRIGFFDAKRGWALGNASPLFPGGVFASRDGGRSWTPLCGAATAGWTSGDFFDPHTGILAGRNAATAAIRRGELEMGRAGGLDLETLRQLRLPAPPYAWLVGDGGAAPWTSDLGGHWQEPPRGFPREVAAMMDFAALAVRGPKCWLAGSPGSRVLCSPDGGRTWNVSPTPTRLPLAAMTFVDDRHGWAVGAMGTILASDDGGRTWRSQRSGGTRRPAGSLLRRERRAAGIARAALGRRRLSLHRRGAHAPRPRRRPDGRDAARRSPPRGGRCRRRLRRPDRLAIPVAAEGAATPRGRRAGRLGPLPRRPRLAGPRSPAGARRSASGGPRSS